jgi:hypothetical protein
MLPFPKQLWLIAALAVSGCASVPLTDKEADEAAKTFETKPGLANIYVYRNESYGAAVKLPVYLDGVKMGATAADTYMMLRVHPGRHTLVSNPEKDVPLHIVAVAGHNYFVWQEVKTGVRRARSELHLVDEAEGKEGVEECDRAESLR